MMMNGDTGSGDDAEADTVTIHADTGNSDADDCHDKFDDEMLLMMIIVTASIIIFVTTMAMVVR